MPVEQSRRLGILAQGFTFGGHPVVCAVAFEALQIYRERDIPGHVRRVAGGFQDGLWRLDEHPLVDEARGLGLLGGLELVCDKAVKEGLPPVTGVAAQAGQMAATHGLIIRGQGDNLLICPPMIVTED